MAHATFDDLIAAKLAKDSAREARREIEVPSLSASLEFERPTDSRTVRYLDKITADAKSSDVYDALVQMIYDACPALQTEELRRECEAVEPTDVVRRIMTIGDVFTVGAELMEFLGLGTVEAEIKN